MTQDSVNIQPPLHPLAIDASSDETLRGDPIDGERYYSSDFMRREWDHMWTKVWHIAGLVNQLQSAGDYIVHDFMHESVMVVKQADGSLRAFYNVCGHRGQRLGNKRHSTVSIMVGNGETMACSMLFPIRTTSLRGTLAEN